MTPAGSGLVCPHMQTVGCCKVSGCKHRLVPGMTAFPGAQVPAKPTAYANALPPNPYHLPKEGPKSECYAYTTLGSCDTLDCPYLHPEQPTIAQNPYLVPSKEPNRYIPKPAPEPFVGPDRYYEEPRNNYTPGPSAYAQGRGGAVTGYFKHPTDDVYVPDPDVKYKQEFKQKASTTQPQPFISKAVNNNNRRVEPILLAQQPSTAIQRASLQTQPQPKSSLLQPQLQQPQLPPQLQSQLPPLLQPQLPQLPPQLPRLLLPEQREKHQLQDQHHRDRDQLHQRERDHYQRDRERDQQQKDREREQQQRQEHEQQQREQRERDQRQLQRDQREREEQQQRERELQQQQRERELELQAQRDAKELEVQRQREREREHQQREREHQRSYPQQKVQQNPQQLQLQQPTFSQSSQSLHYQQQVPNVQSQLHQPFTSAPLIAIPEQKSRREFAHLVKPGDSCQYYLSPEGCPFGDQCERPHKRSPELCKSWNETRGSCVQGNSCKFTHAADILRQPSQNLESNAAPPRPKYRNAPICEGFISSRGCARGDVCELLHPANFVRDSSKLQVAHTSDALRASIDHEQSASQSSRSRRSASLDRKESEKRVSSTHHESSSHSANSDRSRGHIGARRSPPRTSAKVAEQRLDKTERSKNSDDASSSRLDKGTSMSSESSRKNGYWKCLRCGELQLAADTQCRSCGIPRKVGNVRSSEITSSREQREEPSSRSFSLGQSRPEDLNREKNYPKTAQRDSDEPNVKRRKYLLIEQPSFDSNDWQRVTSWFCEQLQAGAPNLCASSEPKSAKRKVEVVRSYVNNQLQHIQSEKTVSNHLENSASNIPVWWSHDAAKQSNESNTNDILSAERSLEVVIQKGGEASMDPARRRPQVVISQKVVSTATKPVIVIDSSNAKAIRKTTTRVVRKVAGPIVQSQKKKANAGTRTAVLSGRPVQKRKFLTQNAKLKQAAAVQTMEETPVNIA